MTLIHLCMPKFNILCNMLKISAGDTWVVHPLGPKWQLCSSVGARGSSQLVQSELQSAHTQQVSSSSIDIKQLRHRLRLSLLVLTLVPCPALLSSWLVPPWWTQVCKTFGSSWIPAFFSMIYLEPRLLLMYDFRKGWRLVLGTCH